MSQRGPLSRHLHSACIEIYRPLDEKQELRWVEFAHRHKDGGPKQHYHRVDGRDTLNGGLNAEFKKEQGLG
jgi:hypothetical protein